MAELAWRDGLERPYPEAKSVLDALSKRYRIGIIANQSPGTEARLKRWGLWGFISLCLPSAETGLRKPDAAFFQLADGEVRLRTGACRDDRGPHRQRHHAREIAWLEDDSSQTGAVQISGPNGPRAKTGF